MWGLDLFSDLLLGVLLLLFNGRFFVSSAALLLHVGCFHAQLF